MKKLLAILTGAAMLLCSVPLTASAEDVNTVPRRFIVMKKAHCVTCDVLTLRCVNDPYIVPERFTGDAAAYMGTFLLEEGKDPLVNAIIAEADYGDVIEYTGSSMTWEEGTMYNEMHRKTVDGKYPEDGEWKYREGERFDIIGTVAGTDYIAAPENDGFEEPARQPEIIITDAEGAMYRVVREDSVDLTFQVELVEDLPMYQDKLADPDQKITPGLRENMPWKGSSQPVIITPRTYSAGYIEKTAAIFSTTADGDPWLAALDSLYTTTGTAIMDKLLLDHQSRIYTSAYTPMILCNLTAEQIEQAAQMDEVACLSLAKNSDLFYFQTMFVVAAKDDEQAHLFEISQERSRTDVSDASTYAHMTFRLNDWMSGGFFTEQCKDLEVGDIVLYNSHFYYNDDSDECLFLKPSPGSKFRKLGNTADCPALTDAVQPTYANCYKLVGDEAAIRAELLRLYGTAYPISYGDVNMDGTVNASDAAFILYNAALMGAYGGNTYLNFSQEASADVNGDGICNASDAALVLQYAAAVGANVFEGDLQAYLHS
ncbi:MAG: dockerin type I repeat-containing protein [Oscillospiraceae bacterium]|nr:dockerin type I repeat-containing protein [Oscillospiraceae bacterium]